MENNESTHERIQRLLASLEETEPAPLDFDELKTCLADLRRRLADLEGVSGELQVLRDDYQQRIAGMVKAIAAVDRRHDRTREATELVASLATMRAAELVACYHRTSARMRDMFPTSFGRLFGGRGTVATGNDVNDFK